MEHDSCHTYLELLAQSLEVCQSQHLLAKLPCLPPNAPRYLLLPSALGQQGRWLATVRP